MVTISKWAKFQNARTSMRIIIVIIENTIIPQPGDYRININPTIGTVKTID